MANSGANFSTLADALAYRDTHGHTLLGTYTGSITYVAGQDNRFITLTTQIPSTIYKKRGDLGVRIGGAGNPIIRCNLSQDNGETDPELLPTTTSLIRLFAPIAETFSGVQIDLYQLVPYGVMILPGQVIEIESASIVIPGHTTIYCPVMRGASITHVTGALAVVFGQRSDQNEIYFKNLVLSSSANSINNFFWQLPFAGTGNSQTLCEYGIFDCDMETSAQDFLYAGNGTLPLGAITINRNRIRGTYDFINPVLSRKFDVFDNHVTMHGNGTPEGSNPAGLPVGQNNSEGYTYPQIQCNVRGNTFDSLGTILRSTELTRPVGVAVRQSMPSQSVVDVANNTFRIVRHSNDVVSSTERAIGVQVTASGTATPTILVRNNTFDVKHTGTGVMGTPNTMHSNNASYLIRRQGNYVVNGTLGSNTLAIPVET